MNENNKIKKYNGVQPGTFYAITNNEARDSGYINYPLWIVNLETGKLTEVEKGQAYFCPDWENKVEYKIFAGKLTFMVATRQDMFKDNFRDTKKYYWEKGKHILFFNQRAAAIKSNEILLKKQKKIKEELDMLKTLIIY